MKTYKNTFPISELSEFAQHFVSENMLFFDIETTGLSATRNHIYCIGCGYRSGEAIQIELYFAENATDEPHVLDAFYQLLQNFHIILTFNGTTFDIPFIIKRTEIFQKAFQKYRDISPFATEEASFTDYFTGKKCNPPAGNNPTRNLSVLQSYAIGNNLPSKATIPCNLSLDLYREVQHMKKLLALPAYRQKCVEEFLGCAREDKFDGGQLIEIYEEYTVHPAGELLHLLLLHNYEDIKGMFRLVDILSYRQLANGAFTVSEVMRETEQDALRCISKENGDWLKNTDFLNAAGSEFLNIQFTPEFPFPQSIRHFSGGAMLTLEKKSARIRFPIQRGELKHFFPNTENYYYLPEEDTVIPKSIGEFVDKAHRIKATKKNCYTKKTCDYIEIPVKSGNGYLKKEYQDKHTYLEINTQTTPSTETLQEFLAIYFTQFL